MRYKGSAKISSVGIAGICLFLVLCLITACSDNQIPSGSRLVISPPSRTIHILENRDSSGQCVYVQDYYQDIPVVVSLLSSDGHAIGDTEVSMFIDYSAGLFSGQEVMQLYQDQNGNGLVDAPDELVNGIDDDALQLRTGRYSGSVQLMIRINLSCSYKGQLYAYAGSVAEFMEISVSANLEGGR